MFLVRTCSLLAPACKSCGSPPTTKIRPFLMTLELATLMSDTLRHDMCRNLWPAQFVGNAAARLQDDLGRAVIAVQAALQLRLFAQHCSQLHGFADLAGRNHWQRVEERIRKCIGLRKQNTTRRQSQHTHTQKQMRLSRAPKHKHIQIAWSHHLRHPQHT